MANVLDIIKRAQQAVQSAQKAEQTRRIASTAVQRAATAQKSAVRKTAPIAGYTQTATKLASSPVNPVKSLTPADIAKQISDAFAKNVYKGPGFQDVLPFYKSWEKLLPAAQGAAAEQVNPELNRQYNTQLMNTMYGIAQGGGRGSQTWGNVSQLGAETERQRKAGILDWLNKYQQGYRELFYNPAQEAFNRATTLNPTKTPTVAGMPTSWNDFMKQYQPGTETGMGTGTDLTTAGNKLLKLPKTAQTFTGNKLLKLS